MTTQPQNPDTTSTYSPIKRFFDTKTIVVILSLLLVFSTFFGFYQYNSKWQQIKLKDIAVKDLADFKTQSIIKKPINQDVAQSSDNQSKSVAQSSSSISVLSIVEDQQTQILPKLYGWIGGNQIQMTLTKTGFNTIKGQYYSSLENKTFQVEGSISQPDAQQRGEGGFVSYPQSLQILSLTDIDNNKSVGKFRFNAQVPQATYYPNVGIDIENQKTNIRFKNLTGLSGNYIDLNNTNYDVYLTTDQDEINNWKVVTISGTILKLDYNNLQSEPKSVFIIQGDNKPIMARDIAKFDKIADGMKVSVTGKIRRYNESQIKSKCEQYNNQPCKNYEAKEGIFNITEAKQIN